MTWQRPVRIAIAVVGLAFAGALFVFRRDPPAPAPAPTGMQSDPAATSESAGGRVYRDRDGQSEFTIDHGGQRTYADGRVAFLSAHVRFSRNGRELLADRLETRGQFVNATEPLQLDLSGHVQLVEGDALRVEAEEATYDERTGTLNIPGKVTFLKGRLSGSGTGATYAHDPDLFRILANAAATIAASEDGGGALALSSSRMSLARDQNYLQLDEAARIVGDTETLSGDSATVSFVDDQGGVKFLELRGHALVVPAAGSTGMPSMKADDITLAFEPITRGLEHATLTGAASLRFLEPTGERSVAATWLDLYLAADARTVTRLDGRDRVVVTLPAQRDAPAREIRAATLVARGTPAAGLETALFEKAVSFIERPTAPRRTASASRTGRAESLTLALDGDLDAIREALFRVAVVFETESMNAEADLARYRSEAGRLVLERGESGGRQPRVRRQDGSFTVVADGIDLALDTEDLKAVGNVTSVTRQEPGASTRGSGLFESGQPVYGSGETLTYDAHTETAVYQGSEQVPARVVQGDNRVAGREIRIEERTNNLRATGAVETVFVEAATEPGSTPRSSDVSADELVYDDAARTATYRGRVKYESADNETTADALVLELSESRAVLGFDATGQPVFATWTGGHEAKGDRLRYDGRTKAYTLSGRPAQAKSPNESGSGCTLSIGPQIVFVPGSRASAQSAAPTETRQVNCRTSIR